MNSMALLGSDSYAITTVCPHIAIQVFHEAGAFSSPGTPAPLCGESWEGPLESRGGGCDGERAWGLGRILREVLRDPPWLTDWPCCAPRGPSTCRVTSG